MSQLTLTLIRLGFLVLLWLFVIGALLVIRSDIFGARMDSERAQRKLARAQAAAAKAARPKRRKSVPTYVTISEGAQRGLKVELNTGPVFIGRDNVCELRLLDDYSSGRHARIFLADNQWWVEDLGSTNGTYLNGNRLQRPAHAETGGQIRIGRTTMTLGR